MFLSTSSSGCCCRQPSNTLQGRSVSIAAAEHSHLEKRGRFDTTIQSLLRCRAICSASGTSVPTCSLQADVLQRLMFGPDVTTGSPFTGILTAAFKQGASAQAEALESKWGIFRTPARRTAAYNVRLVSCLFVIPHSVVWQKRKDWSTAFTCHQQLVSLATRDAVCTAHQPSLWCQMVCRQRRLTRRIQSFGTCLASVTLTSCHFPSASLIERIVISGLSSTPFFTAGKG